MKKHRSFVPSDFSLRDIPGFLAAYIFISALSVVFGLLLESVSPFLGGIICGLGGGFLGALALLTPRKSIDIATLPEPSANVRAKCDDPNCTLVEAVKTYRDETGLSLSQGTAVVKAYINKQQSTTDTPSIHESQ